MSDIRDFCPLWGEWEAEKKLGEGSFGAVWKVKRNAIGGRVFFAAVKHISIPKDESEVERLIGEGLFPDEASAGIYYSHMLQSIADEIDAMHKLQGYTNIVVYEDHKVIPKANGIGYDLFLRMELLQPLTDRIRHGMNVSDVVSLGKDIATAVDVLYKHHMIHRDIKPQNIFVNDKGIYKLGDYGTARALGTGATAMSRKGTYNYMSPEIYNSWKADIRADIYSLGLVLYRLLNGNRLPFLPEDQVITSEMSDAAVIRRISGETIPAPKNADTELSRIVLKACAFNPDDRYRTPEELIRDLEGYRSHDHRQIQSEENEKKDHDPSGSLEFKFSTTGGKSESQPKAPENRKDEKAAAESRPVRTEEQAPKPAKQEEKQQNEKSPEPEKKQKKKWMVPVIAVLAIGLIAGGFFAAGILPPKQTEPVEITDVTVMPEEITEAPTETPTEEPTQEPTDTPTPEPTDTHTPEPTETPTPEPTDTPTPEPTDTPTPEPTDTPTPEPTPIPRAWAFMNASVGDVVEYGEYNKEPISWIVLDVSHNGSDTDVTLISKLVIDYQVYHGKYARTSWEKCRIRQWLPENIKIADGEFTLVPVSLETDGVTTQDQIWFLSEDEYRALPDSVRSALEGRNEEAELWMSIHNTSTSGRDDQGNVVDGWWLRNSGSKASKAKYVSGVAGSVEETEVDQGGGVRPVIRIRVSE